MPGVTYQPAACCDGLRARWGRWSPAHWRRWLGSGRCSKGGASAAGGWSPRALSSTPPTSTSPSPCAAPPGPPRWTLRGDRHDDANTPSCKMLGPRSLSRKLREDQCPRGCAATSQRPVHHDPPTLQRKVQLILSEWVENVQCVKQGC